MYRTAKRKRSLNYSKDDELALLEEISKFQSIVECKSTNKLARIEKEDAWIKITVSYNSKQNQTRKVDQLQIKYDNLKSKARKMVTEQNGNLKRTGGSPYSAGLDQVSEAVLKIINPKTVVRSVSAINSDCVMIPFPEDGQSDDLCQVTPFIESGSETSCSMVNTISELIPLETDYIRIPEHSQSEDLCEGTPCIRTENVQRNLKSVERTHSNRKDACDAYRAARLKKRIARQLLQSKINVTSQQEYYRKKAACLEEEHKKRMALLDLEIAIKKKELLKYE